jgi:hypothetical protein
MPSDLAEAGFLLDFDERVAIGFGDYIDRESLESEEESEELAVCADALRRNPAHYLRRIAHAWPNWKLVWDERELSSFASHLRKRAINGVDLQLVEAPTDNYAVITVLVDESGKVTSARRLRSAARKRRDEEGDTSKNPPELDGNDDWAGVMDCLPDEGFVSRAELERRRAERRPPWDVARTRAVCERLVAEGELLVSADGLAIAQNTGLNRDLVARMQRRARA